MSDTVPAVSTPATPTSTPTEAQPDLSKMSGAEASAYFAEQKAKKDGAPPQKAASKIPEMPTGQDIAKEVAEARKYKVKVNGQDLEVDEGELLRGYSHQRHANKVLQEGMQARKQAEKFIELMKTPEQFFEAAKKLGHDPRLLAEKYLVSQLEDEMLDPKDKELRTVKSKLKALEDMETAQKAKVEADRVEVLKKKFSENYTQQFTAALRDTEIPATKGTVAEMAKYIARSAELGYEMTALEAAKLVKEDIQTAQQRLIGEADGEALIKLLGEEIANKVRKWDTSRLRNPDPSTQPPSEQQRATRDRERGKPHKRMTPQEWRKFNGRG